MGIKDEAVALSGLVEKLNERFGTDFDEADQLFFDQVCASAERNEKVVEAAKANNYSNFAAFMDGMLDDLFIDRMDGNEEVLSRILNDKDFRKVAQEHLAMSIFDRISGQNDLRQPQGGDQRDHGRR